MPGARWWRIGAGILVGVGFLLSLGVSGTWGQERPREEALGRRWLFAPGRVEVGAHMGGGFSLEPEHRGASLFVLLPRIGYVFFEQGAILPGSLGIVAEAGYFTVFQGRTVHMWSLAGLLKYNLWTGTRITPFLEVGAGISYATTRVPPAGTNFNFMPTAGIGLQYAVGQRTTLDVKWRYHHFSNANISPTRNLGIDTSSFLIGFTYQY